MPHHCELLGFAPANRNLAGDRIIPGPALNLEHVALAGHHFVQHGVHKETQQKSGDQSGHNHDRERSLRIGADAVRKRRGETSGVSASARVAG